MKKKILNQILFGIYHLCIYIGGLLTGANLVIGEQNMVNYIVHGVVIVLSMIAAQFGMRDMQKHDSLQKDANP